MAGGRKLLGKLVLFAVLSPLLAAYGALAILTGGTRLLRRARWTLRLLRGTLVCPSCGRANSLYGRWQCQSPGCGAVYLGAADVCTRCNSGSSYFSCDGCQVSILLGPVR
jgi:hypothetical protein